jgi:hypothetical protein
MGLVTIGLALVSTVWIVGATVEEVLLERGILGVIALVLGTFAWQTIKQLRSDLRDSQQRERDLQREVYTTTIPVLDRLTQAADARTKFDVDLLDVMKDVRRLLEERRT